MARSPKPHKFEFDVAKAHAILNRILEEELATVVFYTHYAFMVFGHARIPIRGWFNDGAEDALRHAREAGDMIVRMECKPSLGVARLPDHHHDTIDDILLETLEREEAAVGLYHELLHEIEGKSVVLEEYARQHISEESAHVMEIRMMLRKSNPK